jgi:phosphate:Na+ symporter
MNFGFFDFLALFGSLSLFLFGMKTMSEGIQKLAGDKMRSILSAMTINKFMGVFTGFTVTTLVQSSSASTVMIVSFVNAGLLNLRQAFSVIMGANIGTTTTAWLLSLLGLSKFSIASYSLPLIAISFPLLLMKKEQLKFLGELLLGFALLFMGLDFLKNSVPDLNSNPEIFEFLAGLTDYGFMSTLIFLGIGTLITIVLQSSSATMALTLVMCSNGWISFEHGAAIVLGENIGTTITANLAAIVGNVSAKRAALSHTVFNIIGVIWMLLFFNIFVKGIDSFIVNVLGHESPIANALMIPIGLSIFHSAFNVINTLLFIGFSNNVTNLVEKIIRDKGKKFDRPHLEFLSSGYLQAAELSVFQARREVVKFIDLGVRMFNFIPAMVIETDRKEFYNIRDRVSKYEEITDRMEVEITSFLGNVSRSQISAHSAEELRRMRIVCAEVEKIGDVCFKMANMLSTKKEEKIYFIPEQRSKVFEMFNLTNKAFELVSEFVEKGEAYARSNIHRAIEIEKQMNDFRDATTSEVLGDMEKGALKIKGSFYFNKMVSSCEKIGDNLFNICEAVAGINVE